MRRVTIWRLEEPGGAGPYTGSHCCVVGCGYDCERNPPPDRDTGLWQTWRSLGAKSFQYRFGFRSLAQYRHWFHRRRARRRFAQRGLVLRAYRVPAVDTVMGERQAVFHPRQAVVVAERRPDYI